jgi:hypothetical protein
VGEEEEAGVGRATALAAREDNVSVKAVRRCIMYEDLIEDVSRLLVAMLNGEPQRKHKTRDAGKMI